MSSNKPARLRGWRSRRRTGSLAMDTLLYIPRLMFFIFVALTIILLIRSYVSYTIDIKDAEMEVMANRVVYSPFCLAYQDNVLDRNYPGIVDLDKFTSIQLDTCMHFGDWNDFLAMQITLRSRESPYTVLAETTYNSQGKEAWLPRVGAEGPGGAVTRRVRRYVLYEENGEQLPAILDIIVLAPNI